MNEDIVDNSVRTVSFLKLYLRVNLFSILIMFKLLVTKIIISIPEKSSVASTRKRETFEKHVHFKPATISIWPYF